MKTIKYSIASSVILLSCYFIYQAGLIILADISHYPVKNAINNPSLSSTLSLEKLTDLETKINRAITLRPNNGEYWEYLGRILYLKAIHNSESAELFYNKIQLAYKSHRKASQLRPNWPYSWANMALMKSLLNQFDAGFMHSFNQAEKFGPWEISSNIAIAQAGLNGWQHLSHKMKMKTTYAIERIYQQQTFHARDILAKYELTDVICERAKNLKLAESKVCKS